jgi:hypothetical protein
MMNLPLNFSAPTGQVQNTYAQPTRTNPYLASSQYEGMQLHTPSGYYFQGGKMYEPYTVGTKQVAMGGMSPFGGYNPMMGGGGFGGRYSTVPDIKEGSVQVGSQYFKPFTGNAQGIINGDLSMTGMLGSQPAYQAQPMADLFSSLNANLLQAQPAGDMYGAGRFSGLLGSPIVTTNTQGK